MKTPENHLLTIPKGFSTVSEGKVGKKGCEIHKELECALYMTRRFPLKMSYFSIH